MYILFIVLGVGEGSRDGFILNRIFLYGIDFYMDNIYFVKLCFNISCLV